MTIKISFYVVALTFCTFATSQETQQNSSPQDPDKILLSTAVQLADPFIGTARDKSHTLVFGQAGARGARSSDVQITNNSEKRFILQSTACRCGGFSSDMFPADVIEPMSSVIFGVESYGFMTGLRCNVKYADVDGDSAFVVGIHNPYFGKNWSWFKTKGLIKIFDTVGKGNYNQFRFVVRDMAHEEVTEVPPAL